MPVPPYLQVILADRLGSYTAAAATGDTTDRAHPNPTRSSPGISAKADESSTTTDVEMLADGIAASSLSEPSPGPSSTNGSVSGVLPPAQWRVFWVVLPVRAAGKVMLQRVVLHFSDGASLRWDLASFAPVLRDASLSPSTAPVSFLLGLEYTHNDIAQAGIGSPFFMTSAV